MLEVQLSPVAASARVARRLVRSVLIELKPSEPTVDTAILLVSELVTNAVLHAGTVLVVRVLSVDHCIRVEVTDGDHEIPAPLDVPDDAVSGRGLSLVERLADHWGVSAESRSKTVWFELTR